MKNIAIAFVNPEIVNTYLETIFMFNGNSDEFIFWLYPDERNAPKDVLDELRIPDGLNVKIITKCLHSVYDLLADDEITQEVESYIRNQTHHYKLAVLTNLFNEHKLESVFLMDDDTILLNSPDPLMPEGKNLAFYMANPLYYYHKTSTAHMQELDAYSEIMDIDLKETIPQSDKFYKIGQYNAGHINITNSPDFSQCVRRFYLQSYLKERFHRTVWDSVNNKRKDEVDLYNRCFFDEQRFLTFYFVKHNDILVSKNLNRDSEVYMSFKEDEFIDMSFEQFVKKMSKYTVIHYVSKNKIDRAVKFRELNSSVGFF